MGFTTSSVSDDDCCVTKDASIARFVTFPLTYESTARFWSTPRVRVCVHKEINQPFACPVSLMSFSLSLFEILGYISIVH